MKTSGATMNIEIEINKVLELEVAPETAQCKLTYIGSDLGIKYDGLHSKESVYKAQALLLNLRDSLGDISAMVLLDTVMQRPEYDLQPFLEKYGVGKLHFTNMKQAMSIAKIIAAKSNLPTSIKKIQEEESRGCADYGEGNIVDLGTVTVTYYCVSNSEIDEYQERFAKEYDEYLSSIPPMFDDGIPF
ncbi:hypothetical protein [Vibrio cyclitrophicus]|uniref:hypothetical protein n=1 Tax=Vibrio cyclitrophicus TaxID=47951 RepID=UPI0011B77763|nr:hypothetical protein [Vibrio cyclitrophicus]NOH21216.1 hypothetical protein [Vibrio cyclitrophicus]